MRHRLDILATLGRIGARKLALYGLHRVRLRSGAYERRQPARDWTVIASEIADAATSPFAAPDLARIRELAPDREAAIGAGERILAGELLYFSRQWLPRPRDWQSMPDGTPTVSSHWSRSGVPGDRDVKWIWEASRFDWIYTLGRAWALSGDERFVAGALELVEDWRAKNPPNQGINWNCAQECSIRLFALLWAAGAFRECAALTPARRRMLWETIVALAERVEVSTIYSRAQGNNHLLAEAAALYVAGRVVTRHPRAAGWAEQGRGLFVPAVLDQFERDGSYVLHSTNYAREALRDCAIVLRVADITGDPMPADMLDRLGAAVRFLHNLQDPLTGHVPNYGPNDGSNYMSLSGCGYRDFRPIVQTMSALLGSTRPHAAGPHDEEVEGWHLASAVSTAPLEPEARFRADDGGYYVIRQPRTWAMLRCHTYRRRPTQSDMLHLDFWCDGLNLLTDSGTFQYSGSDRGRLLESTAAHNTVVVNGRDPMRKAGRYLWVNWTRARLLRFEERDGVVIWSGEHDGYEREGVVHRRTVYARGDEWLVVDDLLAAPNVSYTAALRWHLDPAGRWRETDDGVLSEKCGITLWSAATAVAALHARAAARALSNDVISRFYGDVEPVLVVEERWEARGASRRITAIGANGPAAWQGYKID